MLEISIFQVEGLTAQNLSLKVGDVVGLQAPSGAGKSLFLRGLADLIVGKGEIFLSGHKRADFTAMDWRKRVTYAGAKPVWWFDRAADHFADLGWLHEHMARLDLKEELAHQDVARLSSGESQRFALLRALEGGVAGEARFLLLDEPTSALDEKRQLLVEGLLRDELHARRVGLIFVSHDERQLTRFTGRQWQICDGLVREV